MAKVAKKSSKKAASRAKPSAAQAAAPAEPAPVPLEDVLGQDRARRVLDDAITSARVHHAWIFAGPPGVGKFTTALAFAAVLLDPSAEPDLAGRRRPDPQSRVQELLRTGSHPDLHVVRKELARFSDDAQVRARKLVTIPKEVIEEHVIRPAILAPANPPGGLASKVFIVDEAELLDRSPTNAPTQNALLKTLEEPPAGTVIILVTSSEERLLATIRSRCQRVVFGPLPEAALRAWAERRGLSIPPEQAGWLLDYAEGSPGRLQEALESGLAEWGARLEGMLAQCDRGRFPPTLAGVMRELVDGYAEAQVKGHPTRSKEQANRAGADRLFRVLSCRARRGLADPDLAPRALSAIDHVDRARGLIGSNVNTALVCEWLAAAMAAGDDPALTPPVRL